jgi:hypothetical protein
MKLASGRALVFVAGREMKADFLKGRLVIGDALWMQVVHGTMRVWQIDVAASMLMIKRVPQTINNYGILDPRPF